MKKAVIGILAHVDAGKTTLAEAMMYEAGALRKAGRVDHGNTLLDTHVLERERGITIFASEAVMEYADVSLTLLDTPGHVDFSAETERTLSVLDYAILVISGAAGVQAHTGTLWKLLEVYNIPTFVFFTKMDYSQLTREQLIDDITKQLGSGFVNFSQPLDENGFETIAMGREDLLDKYLESGILDDGDIKSAILSRSVFPCFFGSGLKFEGIKEFLDALSKYTAQREYPDAFGARVYKISHDAQGNRLTHLKVTGGKLKVRDSISCGENIEKISQIRIYSGAKFKTCDTAEAGDICAVPGLEGTKSGMGLGFETTVKNPVLEPVMNYRIALPDGVDARTFLPKLKMLEEEDPQLKITWNSHQQEIHAHLMGEVQIEILKSLISERFGIDAEIDEGTVLYKETISAAVEGVGHYEPLRHYSEVHFLLEPLPRGSGVVFASDCSENDLERNWQRLILTHLAERQHLGVLTGSPITDIKITLKSGRAHIKHTEGGDFRQATYRGVRHGLMNAESVLLEPYYSFTLTVPTEQMGRAINDIRMMHGTFDNPENDGNMTVIKGRAPITTLNGYTAAVASYTGGRGRLMCDPDGYDLCHDADKVIEKIGYNPEADLENTPDSVFCAHGAGFNVNWRDVAQYMHLPSCIKKNEEPTPAYRRRVTHIDDSELEAIMEREFGPIKRPIYSVKQAESSNIDGYYQQVHREKYLIIDGYNVIFGWQDLKELAEADLDMARVHLMNILCSYGAYTKSNIILVFDAYKVAGNTGKKFDFHNIHVVYTKENETGDMYIEKLVSDIGKNEKVRVVTNDGLIRLSAIRSGVLRTGADEFEREVDAASAEIKRILSKNADKTRISDILDENK